VLGRVLGPDAGVSATVEVTTSNPRDPGPRTSEWRYYYRNGQTRIEPILTRDTGVSRESLDEMSRAGTDVRAVLLRARRAVRPLSEGPRLSPAANPVSGPGRASSSRSEGAKPVEVGRETVHGHPCRKYEVQPVNSDVDVTFTKWEADDMNGFPVQVAVHHADDVMTFFFRELDRKPPDASLFELPADYKRYESFKDFDDSLKQAAH
jgi:hypothetical protein